MNERWAVDPAACATVGEWRLLMRLFGPDTGRYIISYPTLWRALVKAECGRQLSQLEAYALDSLLQDAWTQKRLLPQPAGVGFEEGKTWCENLQKNPWLLQMLKQVIGARGCSAPLVDIEHLYIDATAARDVESSPEALSAACEAIATISPRLYYVDPKFAVTKARHRAVMAAILQVANRADFRGLEMWVRERDNPAPEQERMRALEQLEDEARVPPGSIALHLVDDSGPGTKMHDRFLFGQYGGVQLGQGFQQLSGGVTMSVLPMAKSFLDTYWKVYQGRRWTFKSQRLTSKVAA